MFGWCLVFLLVRKCREDKSPHFLLQIKPDAVAAGHERDIQQLIELHGFHIIAKKRVQVRAGL